MDGVVRHPGDAEAQARQAIETIATGPARRRHRPEHVVRTRMYVTGRALRRGRPGAPRGVRGVRPVATMVVVAGLIHPDMLVEIEVEATLP